MTTVNLSRELTAIYGAEDLFGFAPISAQLASCTGCKTVLVSFLPYPDPDYLYPPVEFARLLRTLTQTIHAKTEEVRMLLGQHGILFADPPLALREDEVLRSYFSQKWHALQTGLGFIGKNDVFVHAKYGQRVRISTLLTGLDCPKTAEMMESRCGSCRACVDACPHGLISGKLWHRDIRRIELLDYTGCYANSVVECDGEKGTCGHCLLACRFHMRNDTAR